MIRCTAAAAVVRQQEKNLVPDSVMLVATLVEVISATMGLTRSAATVEYPVAEKLVGMREVGMEPEVAAVGLVEDSPDTMGTLRSCQRCTSRSTGWC
jgi:hypothetical protein|eukprot:3456935-Prymnesium_polylepis.1